MGGGAASISDGYVILTSNSDGSGAAVYWGRSFGAWVRAGFLGALPLVILAASPQRVALSIAIGAAYAAAALLLVRPRGADRIVLLYALAAASLMALSLLRAETVSAAGVAQERYALAKAVYFVLAVLPLSVAVALLVRRIEDIRPAAVVYVLVGVTVSVLTVGLCNPSLLGQERYAWQGNLVALSGLLSLQFWTVRRLWLGAALAVLSLVGVAFASSKQSAVAVAVGLVATAAYWVFADRRRPARGRPFGLTRMSLAAILVATVWICAFGALTFVQFQRVRGLVPDVSWLNNAVTRCSSVTGRFVTLTQSAGSRDELAASGWQLFLSNPVFGSGLGSFVGRVRGYDYPHNVPLEVAGELGLVGVAVLLVPLLAGWVRLVGVGALARSRAVASLAAVVLVYAVVANLSGDLSSARALWIFGLVAFKFGFAPLEPSQTAPES